MAFRPTPAKPGKPSPKAHSSPQASQQETQLSDPESVESIVGSVAIDGRFLTRAGKETSALATPVPADGMDDAAVMLRVRSGDQTAFDYLVQKYRRPMVRFMYRMAHNTAAAEDLAQEVFLRVYRSRESYEASAKFTTWLYRIASNLAVNHARDTRHERAENQVSLDEPDEETGMTMDVADSTLSVEENIVRRERMMAIREKVHALPERQKIAVIMHKYQQMDYKQIGKVLKLSESATKSLLFRAYETLRVQLKDFV
jgi:RNA polymerase sigma-70 factor (ECF subfamily)